MTKKEQEKSISEENIQEQKPRRWSKAKWRHQESKYWSEYAYNKFQEGRRWEFSSFDQLQRKCKLAQWDKQETSHHKPCKWWPRSKIMSKQEEMSQDQIKNLLIIMNMRFYARIMWRNDEKGWRNWWQWRYHANFHDELHETSTDQSKIMRWLILTTLFVHLTITMWESNLCKKIYQRSEFRDQKQCWKQIFLLKASKHEKAEKLQIWKWKISGIKKNNSQKL